MYTPKKKSAPISMGLSALALSTVMFGSATWAYGVQQHVSKAKPKIASQPKITENDRIIHVLNRLGFGPRPDDIEKVRKVGLDAYIQQQLHPDTIDDSVVDNKLKGYSELQLSDDDIEAKYKDFVTVDQEAAKFRRAAAKLAAQKASQSTNQAMADTASGTTPAVGAPASVAGGAQANRQALRDMMSDNPDMMRQAQDMRREVAVAAEPIGLLHEEFDAAKLIRAAESQRQLQEVLVDFWSNHFNIDIRKAPCGVLKVLDDRNVIRPHVFGRFRDLLEASAKSPAMLVYLDNFQSVTDNLPAPGRNLRNRLGRLAVQNGAAVGQAPVTPPRRKAGLNENYAREVMELHTLGVDGGYTQQDVREVARCLTGWSLGTPDGRARINRYSEAGEFRFYPRLHDNGQKVVLGTTISAGGGESDGETVLDMLATNPATMRHISYELCQRFVSDEPPTSLIDKCVATWKRTDGDLREIYQTIFTSPEFYSPAAMRKKIKSPFEFAISSVRALGGTLDAEALISRRQLPREANSLIRPPQGGGYLDINTNTLLGQIGTMGEPLFQYQAPTGFPEDSRKWVSSGALISRLNFSLALTEGRVNDVKLDDPSEDAGASMDVGATIDRMANRILHGEISASTRATLIGEAKAEAGPSPADRLTPAKIAALLLGSPEFQRR